MKIYSNTLTVNDLHDTVKQIPGMNIVAVSDIPRPRLRGRGWSFHTIGSSKRPKNSGTYGAKNEHAATYDDHGQWFALLYNIDPKARIACYKDAEDFHKKTQNKYKIETHAIA